MALVIWLGQATILLYRMHLVQAMWIFPVAIYFSLLGYCFTYESFATAIAEGLPSVYLPFVSTGVPV